MDIGLLKTFLEVSRTRHFGRAADNLFVTSAAVSARIKLLEGQLGVELFVRHRGNMQLTSAGERLVPLAESMIHTWVRTQQEVSLQPDIEARLHLGATTNLWELFFQQKLPELLAAKPEVAIRAEGHTSDDLMRLLLERKLDLVFMPDPTVTSETQTEKAGELTLVLASDRACSISDAVGKGYVYVDWGTRFAGFHAEKFGHVNSMLSVNMASIAISLICTRGGAAYLPKSLADSHKGLQIVQGAPAFSRPVYACYRDGNARISLIREVVSLLKNLSI